jgi:hypothetical protein
MWLQLLVKSKSGSFSNGPGLYPIIEKGTFFLNKQKPKDCGYLSFLVNVK